MTQDKRQQLNKAVEQFNDSQQQEKEKRVSANNSNEEIAKENDLQKVVEELKKDETRGE